jgi:hypothetical protein
MHHPWTSFFIFSCCCAVLILESCHPGGNQGGEGFLLDTLKQGEFIDYWYRGDAEINSYNLQQFRYGEVRQGEAILLFVTEDFSKSKQVKIANPDEAEEDRLSVLKLNHIRRFNTGIYDYSLMESIFTPVNFTEYPHSLKTTCTLQEWNGQTFTQLNLEDDNYRVTTHSYFEEEGDDKKTMDAVLLEDELWTRLRIHPQSLEAGEVEIIPATFYAQLQHQPLKPRKARIRFEEREAVRFLILEYLHIERTLTIAFQPDFPYKILSWTEQDSKEVTSQGTLKESLKVAYWRKNKNEFEFLRDSLQLH